MHKQINKKYQTDSYLGKLKVTLEEDADREELANQLQTLIPDLNYAVCYRAYSVAHRFDGLPKLYLLHSRSLSERFKKYDAPKLHATYYLHIAQDLY